MKIDQVVALLVRVFAVYLLSIILFNAVASALAFSNYGQGAAHIPPVAFFGLFVLLTIVAVLWFCPLLIARSVMPKSDAPDSKINVSYDDLAALCFGLLGLWIAVGACADLLRHVFLLAKTEWASAGTMRVSRAYGNLLEYAVQLVMGCLIFCGAGKIAALARRMRS